MNGEVLWRGSAAIFPTQHSRDIYILQIFTTFLQQEKEVRRNLNALETSCCAFPSAVPTRHHLYENISLDLSLIPF